MAQDEIQNRKYLEIEIRIINLLKSCVPCYNQSDFLEYWIENHASSMREIFNWIDANKRGE